MSLDQRGTEELKDFFRKKKRLGPVNLCVCNGRYCKDNLSSKLTHNLEDLAEPKNIIT